MGVTDAQAALLLAIAAADLDAAGRYARLALGLTAPECGVRDDDLTAACGRFSRALDMMLPDQAAEESAPDVAPYRPKGLCPGMGACARILTDKARECAVCAETGAERATVLLRSGGDADARRRMGDVQAAHLDLVRLIDRIHEGALRED